MKYIDIHGHINFKAYDADRQEVISRALAEEVGTINSGTDLESSRELVSLAAKNENMWATIGLHPTNTSDAPEDPEETGSKGSIRPGQEFDEKAFLELGRDEKVVGVGECGLDYFHSCPEDIEIQREVFLKHIELANKLDKPLVLHVRKGKDSGKDAYIQAVQILRECANVRADFHFFAGNMGDLKAVLDAGSCVSFTGVLTFTRDYDELVKYAPLDRIMSETDCPYVSPVPHRGKRNEPVFVKEVVRAIGRIKGIGENEVAEKLVANAVSFFKLKAS